MNVLAIGGGALVIAVVAWDVFESLVLPRRVLRPLRFARIAQYAAVDNCQVLGLVFLSVAQARVGRRPPARRGGYFVREAGLRAASPTKTN